jgi:hypothetical protein
MMVPAFNPQVVKSAEQLARAGASIMIVAMFILKLLTTVVTPAGVVRDCRTLMRSGTLQGVA